MRSLLLLFVLGFFLPNADAQFFAKVKKIVPNSEVPRTLAPSGESFEVSFKVLDKNDKALRGKNISITVTKGRSTISDVSTKSNGQGIVSFLFSPADYPENAIVKISYAPVTSKVTDALDIDDSNEITYFQEFFIKDTKVDYTTSRAHMTSSRTLTQNDKELVFQIEMKNRFSENVESDDYQFELMSSDFSPKLLSQTKKGEGVFEYKYEAPKKAGKYEISINFNNNTEAEIITVNPVLNYKNAEMSVSKKSSNTYDLKASLKDLNGDTYTDLKKISSELNSDKSELKIKQIDKLHYEIEVPEGEGSANLELFLSGEEFIRKRHKLDWVYFPYTLEDVYVKVHPENIMATGYDTANLEVHFKNLTNSQISKIAATDNFKAVISSGEGELSAFELVSDSSGKKFLKAKFTSPFMPGKTHFDVHNKLGLIDSSKFITYDINLVQCESTNLVDYDVLNQYLQNDIELMQKIVDGLNKSQGFELTNNGPNDIVPEYWERSFEFSFPDQAKQLMKLTINHNSNHPDAKVSSTHMLTSLYFFPRSTIPRIDTESGDAVKVYLPTGEEVLFDKKTKKIVGGVLEEGPVDARDDRFSRTFPDVRYKGKGYVLRVNARGQMPESGNFNKSKISGEFGHKGGEGAMIYRFNEKTQKTEKCIVSKNSLFKKLYHGDVPNKDNEIGSVFKFATDKEFYEFIDKNCKFN